MQAHYYKLGEYTVVEIKGRIEADQNKPFRDICEKQLKNKHVVFCLDQLSFTASANISTFFESINLIEKVKLVGLTTDFYRLLDLKGMNTFKVFKSVQEAVTDKSTQYRVQSNSAASIPRHIEIEESAEQDHLFVTIDLGQNHIQTAVNGNTDTVNTAENRILTDERKVA